mgnify:CR=1 FL=1|jgi:hypothetical protein
MRCFFERSVDRTPTQGMHLLDRKRHTPATKRIGWYKLAREMCTFVPRQAVRCASSNELNADSAARDRGCAWAPSAVYLGYSRFCSSCSLDSTSSSGSEGAGASKCGVYLTFLSREAHESKHSAALQFKCQLFPFMLRRLASRNPGHDLCCDAAGVLHRLYAARADAPRCNACDTIE